MDWLQPLIDLVFQVDNILTLGIIFLGLAWAPSFDPAKSLTRAVIGVGYILAYCAIHLSHIAQALEAAQ